MDSTIFMWFVILGLPISFTLVYLTHRYFEAAKAREEAEREAVRERFKKRCAEFMVGIESERQPNSQHDDENSKQLMK